MWRWSDPKEIVVIFGRGVHPKIQKAARSIITKRAEGAREFFFRFVRAWPVKLGIPSFSDRAPSANELITEIATFPNIEWALPSPPSGRKNLRDIGRVIFVRTFKHGIRRFQENATKGFPYLSRTTHS